MAFLKRFVEYLKVCFGKSEQRKGVANLIQKDKNEGPPCDIRDARLISSTLKRAHIHRKEAFEVQDRSLQCLRLY